MGVLASIVATMPAVASAQAPAAQAAPAQRLFPNGAGMILNFVKPDKTADFEMVMGRLKEALTKSEKPERKQQANGWKVYKSPDPAGGWSSGSEPGSSAGSWSRCRTAIGKCS